MRKDGKSSFQAKKEKLLKIKNRLIDLKNELWLYQNIERENDIIRDYLQEIWEIVKNEK